MEFLSTFWRSFWSPLAYKNALAWRWKILAYFCCISLFSAILISVALRPQYVKFIDSQVKVALADFQSFEIVNDKAKTPNSKNLAYDLPNGDGFLSISETHNPSPKDYIISIEGDKIKIATNTFSLSDFAKSLGIAENTAIDKAKFFQIIDTFLNSYYLIVPPILFLSALISNAFFVVILSIAAYTMLMTSALKRSFVTAIKISVLAITPMVFFQSISPFFSTQDSAGFLYGLISIILVWYMIRKLPAYFED